MGEREAFSFVKYPGSLSDGSKQKDQGYEKENHRESLLKEYNQKILWNTRNKMNEETTQHFQSIPSSSFFQNLEATMIVAWSSLAGKWQNSCP